MPEARILQGWGAIENFTKESRMTLLRKNYPIYKDLGGSVWADSAELNEHRVRISAQVRSKVRISAQDPQKPLK